MTALPEMEYFLSGIETKLLTTFFRIVLIIFVQNRIGFSVYLHKAIYYLLLNISNFSLLQTDCFTEFGLGNGLMLMENIMEYCNNLYKTYNSAKYFIRAVSTGNCIKKTK